MAKRYSREFLLSVADSEHCRRAPSDLDPAVRRDSPSPDLVDCGVSSGSKFLRRDRDYSQDLPEWRNRNSVNGGGLLPNQGPARRKTYEEDGPGYSRGGGGGGGGAPGGRQGGQSRWDHRSSIDRERERERGNRNWEGSEHDGLLGSGGGLRGAYPGGSDRVSGGSRGGRSNAGESRLNKFSGGYRDFDAIDGETFGEKGSTEGREEEERKRRESFESMRKEQQRLKEEKKRQKNEEETRVPPAEQIANGTKPEARPSVPPGFGIKASGKNNEKIKEEKIISDGGKLQSDAVDPLAIACSTVSITEAETFALSSDSGVVKVSSRATEHSVVAAPSSSPKTEMLLTRTSSKFAHLFSVEDENSAVDILSLFGTASKDGGNNSPQSPVLQISEMKPSSEVLQHGAMLPIMPVGPSLEDIEKGFDPEPSHGSNPQTFLTCEDIEQSLLAEATSDAHKEPTMHQKNNEDWKHSDAAAGSDVSRHLLSLLQKASAKPESGDQIKSKGEDGRHEANKDGTETGAATLEALFGMSFMMELRSTDAPLSAKAAAETNHPLTKNAQPAASEVLDGKYVHAAAAAAGRSSRSYKQELPENNSTSAAASGPDLAASDARRPAEELDGGVLNDFLRFKKAMQHRGSGNDSLPDGSLESSLVEKQESSHRSTPAVAAPVPANLYRSHSPPLINQKSSSLQLQQQLQQALGARSSIQAKQQQQQLANGDLSSGYSRAAPRASFSRLQQAMFEQQQQQQLHAHHFHQGFHPPQSQAPFGPQDHHHLLYSSKQQQQQRPHGFFPPNGSTQQQQQQQQTLPPHAGLHHPPGLPMSFGHVRPPLATPGGFVGLPPPNDSAGAAFLAADGGLDSRWRDHHHLALYHHLHQQQHQAQQQPQPQPQQQQPMFGAHEIGFQ